MTCLIYDSDEPETNRNWMPAALSTTTMRCEMLLLEEQYSTITTTKTGMEQEEQEKKSRIYPRLDPG